MTTQTEALKIARTALGVQLDALLGKAGHLQNDDRRRYAENGIKAIDEALAQPEQEPVAYCDIHHLPEPCVQCAKEHEGYNIPPQPKEPEQEPVAVYGYCPECGAKGVMRERRLNGNDICAIGHTYPSREAATSPQRKPLPIERHHRNVGVRIGSTLYPVSVVRAIEAAHGIKGNT